ncbi:MAG: Asp-tRNA(Asn)/Glu-tRNA(Gln) amidotransferase subunit GatC [Acidimicrobiales bacterium]|nr:Asp-tRNA(Asn)/Glu-tRNA(Gln) amidotransferase subunit GatC [Acidimicrobiales bacterium]
MNNENLITEKDVAHVAVLARLHLSEKEITDFTVQLRSILEHGRDITALDLADIPPTSGPIPLENVFREDVKGGCVDKSEVLSEAPGHQEGQFLVPPLLDGSE